MESRECGSIAAEKTDRVYLSHMLQLTLLASETIEAILDVRQSFAAASPQL